MVSTRTRRLALIVCLVAVALVGISQSVEAQGNCVSLNGTITGQFLAKGPQGPGWYGAAYLTFDDGAVINARVFDKNDGKKANPSANPDGSGSFAGDEILTFTVDGLSTFQAAAHFIGVAGTTPYAYQFNETGKILPDAGQGVFAGMTGNVSIHGSFVMGGGRATKGLDPDHPWVWIAEIHGSVCPAR